MTPSASLSSSHSLSSSQSPRNLGKRVADPAFENPLPKRRTFEGEVDKAVQVVQACFPALDEYISRQICSDKERNANMAVLASWKIVCRVAQNADSIWSTRDKTFWNHRLPNNDPLFAGCNDSYHDLVSILEKSLTNLPEPSVFASKWPAYQDSPEARLLCLRPSTARGLPLRLLHDVFRHYLINVAKPLPTASVPTKAALAAAKSLCAAMADSFSNLNDNSLEGQRAAGERRREEFVDITGNMFGVATLDMCLSPPTDLHGGYVDAAYIWEDIFMMLAEFKAEPGAGGDAYMQIARCYHLAVQVLKESAEHDGDVCSFMKQGAPMFLLCVMGPVLLVAGGFFDGDKVVVEPLGDTCIMFEDDLNERQDKLARVLYALNRGINEIKGVTRQSSPASFPPLTPRVYKSCKLYGPSDSPAGILTFTKKLDFPQNSGLLFAASLSVASLDDIPVFVKVRSGNYGEEVHRLLASKALAPRLIAYADPDGVPKAYVMEYLQHPEWITLFDYLKVPDISSRSMSFIRSSMDVVLNLLEETASVHGDLRSINIMVKVSANNELVLVDNRAVINVIDFDWAGKAGEISYPVMRNESIHGMTWPGEAGGAIKLGHDRILANSWSSE